jgi:hypothetical protein
MLKTQMLAVGWLFQQRMETTFCYTVATSCSIPQLSSRRKEQNSGDSITEILKLKNRSRAHDHSNIIYGPLVELL